MACMFCTRCGKCAMVKETAAPGRCPVCGTSYADGEAKCPNCHAPRIVPAGAGIADAVASAPGEGGARVESEDGGACSSSARNR